MEKWTERFTAQSQDSSYMHLWECQAMRLACKSLHSTRHKLQSLTEIYFVFNKVFGLKYSIPNIQVDREALSGAHSNSRARSYHETSLTRKWDNSFCRAHFMQGVPSQGIGVLTFDSAYKCMVDNA